MGKGQRILVVDGSRVVRATLRKHLTEAYTVIEESDGESAWQTLMLDAGISAVISGAHPPRLDALDLLGRMRTRSKRHLHGLPFLLVVSDVENHADRERDLAAGVTGFISKSMKKGAILERLAALVAAPDKTDDSAEKHPNSAPESHSRVLDSETLRSRISALDIRTNHAALVFAIDGRSGLKKRFGESTLARIDARIAELIAARLEPEGLLGHWATGRLAAIAPGVDRRASSRFARQLGKCLCNGQITVRGEAIALTLSVGLANSAEDGLDNPQALLALAETRLEEAWICGGNTVIGESRPDSPVHCQRELSHDEFTQLTEARWLSEDFSRDRMKQLAPAVFPLISALDRELKLGLPLAEIDRRLRRYVEETELPG